MAKLHFHNTARKYLPLFVTFILVLSILSYPYLRSGKQADGSYLAYGGHDTFWHFALISEIAKKIPPDFPAISGSKLYNYNYGSDLIFGFLEKYTKIPLDFLYFKFGFLFYTSILIVGLYKLSREIKKWSRGASLSVFTAVFSSSTAFLIPIFSSNKLLWHGNSFMLDQIYDTMMNPHDILGFSLIVWICYFFIRYLKKHNILHGFISSLFLGFLFFVKSYFAIPLLFGLAITLLSQFSKNILKNLLVIIFAVILTGIILLPILQTPKEIASQSLIFRPGWILSKMIEDANRFHQSDLFLKLNYYQNASNLWRILFINANLFIYYFIGNLWIRILGLLFLITERRKLGEIYLFLFSIIIFSLIMPLFIVPSSNFYNATQISAPAILLSGLLLGIYISSLKSKLFRILLITLATLTFWLEWPNIIVERTYAIKPEEYSSLLCINQNVSANSVILIDPRLNSYDLLLVPGLAKRTTYFSGGDIAKLLGYDFSEREILNKKIFNSTLGTKETIKFLTDSKINYIYTINEEILNKNNINYNLICDYPEYKLYKSK